VVLLRTGGEEGVIRHQHRVRAGGGSASLPAVAAVIGIAIGLGLVTWAVTAPSDGSVSPGLPGGGVHPPPRTNDTNLPVIVSAVGTDWPLTPPSTWCRQVTTTETGPNGTSNSTYTSCESEAVWIVLNVTGNSTLSGTISVNGSFQVWLFAESASCEMLGYLTHQFFPCPPPSAGGSWFGYTWNFSVPSAASLDLATLSFNATGSLGVLPPIHWTLVAVDTEPTTETGVVAAAVTLTLV
jgi:hypothetical protein